jgi:hypothetical protein
MYQYFGSPSRFIPQCVMRSRDASGGDQRNIVAVDNIVGIGGCSGGAAAPWASGSGTASCLPRVVPWISWQEWEAVAAQLFPPATFFDGSGSSGSGNAGGDDRSDAATPDDASVDNYSYVDDADSSNDGGIGDGGGDDGFAWYDTTTLPPSSTTRRLRCAVSRVRVWRARGVVPVAVDATAALVELLLPPSPLLPTTSLRSPSSSTSSLSSSSSPLRSEAEHRLALSMTLTRLVNGVCDKQQKKQRASSVAAVAASLHLPLSLVDVRHAATHQALRRYCLTLLV